jgi:hypothetical protein
MTASRDPDRLIHAFLDEGLDELPDPVYDAVRDRIELTPQRAVVGPWRGSDVNRYLKIGLAAAAALVIAVVAYQLSGGFVGGPGPSPSGSSAEPTPSEPAPSASIDTGFILWAGDAPGEVAITVTIPAPGWSGDQTYGVLEKGVNGGDPPDGAGMIVFEGPLYVYGDPCQWSGTAPETPATTVDELVAALSAQALREATEPVDITVGGYAGKSVSLHVPIDIAWSAGEFTECDEGNFASWTTPGQVAPERTHQGPGQIDELWILDVDGVMVVIDTAYYAVTPQTTVQELRAIAQSATFDRP